MLKPLGWLYGRIADLRNVLYDKGSFKSFPLGARTISIGNITTGGTGKTPLVAYVAELLADEGEKVCILTRGYGRENPGKRVLVSDLENVLVDARMGGDEPVELARKLIGKAIVIADADRVSAAAWAKEKFDITAFVLDDGFQHRRVKRDLDIVCIDASDPFGNGSVLPAGRLREPVGNLRRADTVVITRANLAQDISNLRSEISGYAPDMPIFEGANKIRKLVDIGEFQGKVGGGDMRYLLEKQCAAFCGLGNPTNFFAQLISEGLDIVQKKTFPDHHYYTQEEIRALEDLARSAYADALLTTAKDAVKLTNIKFMMPCFVVETEIVLNDSAAFRELIIASS